MELKIALVLATSTVNFIAYLCLSLFILIRLRFRLDTVSLVSIAAMLLVLMSNFIEWLVFVLLGYGDSGSVSLEKTPLAFIYVNEIATVAYTIVGYFFCFETKLAHEQIKSTSFDDFHARQSRVRLLRNLFMILAVAI